jgi:hypothetical protein
MNENRRARTVAAIALMLFSACATINTGADYDAGVTLDRFKTFNWGGGDTLPVGDPRLDNNPFFDARVRAAVELELAARRLRRTDFRSAGAMSNLHCNQRHSAFGMRFSISRLRSSPCGRSLRPQFAAAVCRRTRHRHGSARSCCPIRTWPGAAPIDAPPGDVCARVTRTV